MMERISEGSWSGRVEWGKGATRAGRVVKDRSKRAGFTDVVGLSIMRNRGEWAIVTSGES